MDDLELYRKAISLLDGGQRVALVTVTATTGSTPGKTGFKMLVFDGGGSIAGTVGGGLVEARMIEEAARMLDRPASRTFRFELAGTAEDEPEPTEEDMKKEMAKEKDQGDPLDVVFRALREFKPMLEEAGYKVSLRIDDETASTSISFGAERDAK